MTIKIIIDTDPGVDDAMAILSAFNWQDVDVVGLTTLFGNVPTELATRNALIIRALAAQHDPAIGNIPVVQGSLTSFAGIEKHRIADFVHGQDGLGDQGLPGTSVRAVNATSSCICKDEATPGTAADFIVDTIRANPGEVVVLALAALTNVALALQKDPSIAQQWHKLVALGGAFQAAGNVNPAAEANMFGDPEAADYVMRHTTAGSTYVIGLDVTHDCLLTEDDLVELQGKGRHGTTISDISKFYLDYHKWSYKQNAVHVHDPSALIACVRPDLFTWHEGAVVVCTEGPLRGKTLVDVTNKEWVGDNEWLHRPKIRVALHVKAGELVALCKDLMSR